MVRELINVFIVNERRRSYDLPSIVTPLWRHVAVSNDRV